MVKLVGEDCYVRWMDDQNMAVKTKAEGLRVLQEVGRSLARLHLTPNGQKSRVLALEDARRHYHLDLNAGLDKAEEFCKKAARSKTARALFVKKVRGIWRRAKHHEGVGEFTKIIKRLYRLASLAGLDIFRDRAERDVLDNPALVERIAAYVRCTGSVYEYLDFVEKLMANPEQVYPDVNIALTESLLRIEPDTSSARRLQGLAKSLISRRNDIPGMNECAATATLLALRFGMRGLVSLLKRCFEDKKDRGSREVVRSAAIVYASRHREACREVQLVASTLLRNHLSNVVHLLSEVASFEEVPNRYRSRLRVNFDSVAGTKYLDMRVVLAARLLLLSEHRAVHDWVHEWKRRTALDAVSAYDKRLLRRLLR
jgi:hypothetical protein